MEKLSQEELRWFKALQTKYIPFPQKRENDWKKRIQRQKRLKGTSAILIAGLLFWISFPPVWGNPSDDSPPEGVLIPIDELVRDEKNQMKSQLEVPNRSDTDSEKELPSVTNERHPTNPADPKVINPTNDDSSSSKTEPSSNVNPSNAGDETQKRRHNLPSTVQTEEGGKLPDTATPFTALLLRGMALVCLGFGLRWLYRSSSEKCA